MMSNSSNQIVIQDFDDLIEFLETHDIDEGKINEILLATLKMISVEPFPKKDLISKLKAFWEKWKDEEDWPLFLESDEYD